jgi:hypothetical protein
VLLSQFRFRVNERFLYEYDFGDLWRHQIRFERIHLAVFRVCISQPANYRVGVTFILGKNQAYSAQGQATLN